MELPEGKPDELGLSGRGLNRITEEVEQFVRDKLIQGAVVGVTRGGKVVYLQAHGYADLDTKAPMQPDALFQMASSTKPVLGVAAMMMIEEGRFSPDDAVQDYVPEFRDIPVAVLKDPSNEDISPATVFAKEVPAHRLVKSHRPVTIHDLLTHTSGLASSGLGSAVAEWGSIGEQDTLATWIPKVASGPLDFQPGTRWSYSGTVGLDVVARIIEIVSDTPFNEFVHERIFKPLDMKDTDWNLAKSRIPRLVVIRNDKNSWQKTTRYFSGSIGLISTARDYLHFEQMLVNGGTLFGNRLLKPESVQLMSRDHVGELFGADGKGKDSGSGFGYTVSVLLDPKSAGSARSAGAFGWGGAAGTVSWTDPSEQMAAVVMVQQPTKEVPEAIERAIRDAIVHSI